MTKRVLTIAPETTVRRAAKAMRERRVGSVVVVREGHAVGILTERDITGRIVAEGRDADATTVREVMSAPLVTIEPAAHMDDALHLMAERGIKRLVVTQEGHVRGILTVTDIAHAQTGIAETLREALRAGWQD